jgi:hypothetical protein
MAKRITAVVVYDYGIGTMIVKQIENNGEHWKEIFKKHPEFEEDTLEWVSDDFDEAYMQFIKNELIVDFEHYDIQNPMTKRSLVQDEN